MGPADKIQVMSIQEFTNDICPKREGDTTVILSPALNVLVRVWPQQITQ